MRRLFLSVCLLLGACTNFSPEHRRETAEAMAGGAGWSRFTLQGQRFAITGYAPASLRLMRGDTLAVYIEGDGLAWVSPAQPSDDPTPLRPVALEMALAHPGGAAAYLGRPCQYRYTAQPECNAAVWTSDRYGPAVIDDMNHVLEQLRQRSGAGRLVLVGHSGGGTVAALLAARRADVALLVTAASNLDVAAWASARRLQPLSGSLNPADEWSRLASVPQMHFVGANDRVVRLADLRAYQAHFAAGARPALREVPGFDHSCCWGSGWAKLMMPLMAPLSPQAGR